MKSKSKIIITIIISIALLLLFIGRCVWVSEPIAKTAVVKNELDGIYVLCTRERVTGFDWRVVSGYESSSQNELCNISGVHPFEELNLKHDFVMAENTYVFYVEKRNEYYSEELGETVVEYVVSDWDILYPVRHGNILGLLKSPKYILESDLDQ